jgi:PTS hybrid protein
MALGARGGDTVRMSAAGPEATEALRRIRDLADRRFDE